MHVHTHTHTYVWERFRTEAAVPVKSPRRDVSRWLSASPQELPSPALLPKTHHAWVKGRVFPTEPCGRVLGGLRLLPQRTGPASSGPARPVHIPAMRTGAEHGHPTPVVPRSPPAGILGLPSGCPIVAVGSSSLLGFRKTPVNCRRSRAEYRV